MTRRARRWWTLIAVVVAVLFVGRWATGFLTERWWAATISPGAASFVTTWTLYGLALELGAIGVASLWFVVNALLVARSIASVQVARRIGDLHLREAVPTRLLLATAAAIGILLGVIAGAGARAWRQPALLAWQGVRLGVRDPFLHRDLGFYVAQLPLWDVMHRFATVLTILGLAFGLVLYGAIGAFQRERRAIMIHPDARRHLAVLLAFVAIVMATGYLLQPFHLVATSAPTLTSGGAQAVGVIAHVMVGVALATAILTWSWGGRGRGVMLVAAWIVLATGAMVDQLAIPLITAGSPPDAAQRALAQRIDQRAWGIALRRDPSSAVPSSPLSSPAPPPVPPPPIAALWDGPLLSALISRGNAVLDAATPTFVASEPAWLVAIRHADRPGSVTIAAVASDSVRVDGTAIWLPAPPAAPAPPPPPFPPPGSAAGPRLTPGSAGWPTVTDARVTVGAPPWRAVELGVAPHGTAGRLMLAWARQAPAMLTDSARGFDWHLTPSGRSDAVLPMFEWLPARLVMVDRRPTWLVHGMLRIHAMPLSTRALWHGRTVAGMMPAVVSVIDLATGAMQFYLDPAADSLARAWARVVGPLIASSRALPQAVRTADGYDADWLDAQLSVLSGPVWNDGRQLRRLAGREDIVPVWTDGGNAAWQGALLAPTSDDALAAVATAFRADGAPVLALVSPPLPSDGAAASQPGELHRLWNAAAPVRHLRDSTRAAGDTVGWAGMRWRSRGNALAAWDALYALSRHRPPSLLWLATAVDDRVGGGRRPQGAWADETAARTPAANVVSDPGVVLEQARQWVQRADSALSRGDLAAFARAFDQVRRLLGPASDSLDH